MPAASPLVGVNSGRERAHASDSGSGAVRINNGAVAAVVVSLTALGGWIVGRGVAAGDPGRHLCLQPGQQHLFVDCELVTPTSTLVIPANKIVSGNGKTIDGRPSHGRDGAGWDDGRFVRTRWAATIRVPEGWTGIAFK